MKAANLHGHRADAKLTKGREFLQMLTVTNNSHVIFRKVGYNIGMESFRCLVKVRGGENIL